MGLNRESGVVYLPLMLMYVCMYVVVVVDVFIIVVLIVVVIVVCLAPDSSRYWIADTYDAAMVEGGSGVPGNIDKGKCVDSRLGWWWSLRVQPQSCDDFSPPPPSFLLWLCSALLEFVRLWYKERCDPYDDAAIMPTPPNELLAELARRYLMLYELITGNVYAFPEENGTETGTDAINALIQKTLVEENLA